jgi:hypothetical protein
MAYAPDEYTLDTTTNEKEKNELLINKNTIVNVHILQRYDVPKEQIEASKYPNLNVDFIKNDDSITFKKVSLAIKKMNDKIK